MKRISTIVISYLFALTFLQCMNQLQYSASIISSTWASLNPNSNINFLARADFVNNASQSAFPMTRSPRHHLNRHYTTYTYNETWEMNRFFNETYIERLGGAWDSKKRRYSVPGYINGWEMFHFHHVCIRGGSDGLYVGMHGVDNDWSYMANKKNRIMLPSEWHKFTRQKGLTPMFIHKLQYKGHVNLTMKHGSTLFMNCFHQHQKASNPAHFMMKMGVWYETALCQSNNNNKNIFANAVNMPFKHVQLHQCANPSVTKWIWGQNMWEIIKDRSDKANMTDYLTSYDTVGFHPLQEIPADRIECFEDLYLSARMGLWMQGRANLVHFRKDTFNLVKEPKAVVSNPENITLEHGFDVSDVFTHKNKYCNAQNKLVRDGLNITNARIKIFQRTGTIMLRKFVNLDEVVQLAQEYTTRPIEVLTTNATTSVQEQIEMFNDYDVLITAHGSHLANGLFTMHPETKAVIEVVAFVFDSVFYGNYNHWLGFGDYILSTGHLTPGAPAGGRSFYFGDVCPFQKDEDFASKLCNDTVLKLGDYRYPLYPKKVQQTWKTCNEHLQTRQCDTKVNIPVLRSHIDKLFTNSLCRVGAEDKHLDHIALSTDSLTAGPTPMGGWYANFSSCETVEGGAESKLRCQREKVGMGLPGGVGTSSNVSATSVSTPAAAPTPSVSTTTTTTTTTTTNHTT